MDPKNPNRDEPILAILVLLLILFCVLWVIYKVASFLYNAVFPPPVVFRPHQVNYVPEGTWTPRRKVIAIDTEMVGAGPRGERNMLARVSLVGKYDEFYDKFVAPIEPVTDYRTFVSGIRPKDLEGAQSFYEIQKQVKSIINGCILVGHDIQNDLRALELTHPEKLIRDTAFYKPFRRVSYEKPSLKYLAREFLGRSIQVGEHSSLEDARAAMDLYLEVADQWEWSLM